MSKLSTARRRFAEALYALLQRRRGPLRTPLAWALLARAEATVARCRRRYLRRLRLARQQ